MVIRRIGVASLAKISGVMYAAIGLIVGLMFAMISAIGAGIGTEEMPAGLAAIFGVGAIVGMPIFYGVMGLVGGAIGALIYNLFAGLVGGVELEVDTARP